MPRHPDTTPDVQAVRALAFSTLAHRLAAFDGERFPFHVGDTWMQAPAGCRMEDLAETRWPGLNRYASPKGTPELLEAVAGRVATRSGLATSAEQVLDLDPLGIVQAIGERFDFYVVVQWAERDCLDLPGSSGGRRPRHVHIKQFLRGRRTGRR